MTLELELPYPPSINHYWRRVGPRTLISREGRRFRQRVLAILAGLGVEPLVGRLTVQVEVFPPDGRRRDLDNCLKSLFDALEKAGAYHDDSQITVLQAIKHKPEPSGRVVVTIKTIEVETCRRST
jgi:crossover junction endodeoxyribonuclease RusA